MLRYFPLLVTHLVVLGSFEEGCTSLERTTCATEREEETKKLVCLVTGQRGVKTITRIGYDVTIVLIVHCQSFVKYSFCGNTGGRL